MPRHANYTWNDCITTQFVELEDLLSRLKSIHDGHVGVHKDQLDFGHLIFKVRLFLHYLQAFETILCEFNELHVYLGVFQLDFQSVARKIAVVYYEDLPAEGTHASIREVLLVKVGDGANALQATKHRCAFNVRRVFVLFLLLVKLLDSPARW